MQFCSQFSQMPMSTKQTPTLCIQKPTRVHRAGPSVEKKVPHLESGLSGKRSITYLPFATLTIGTPGIFLILRFKSRSLVPTRYMRCFCTLSTRQS